MLTVKNRIYPWAIVMLIVVLLSAPTYGQQSTTHKYTTTLASTSCNVTLVEKEHDIFHLVVTNLDESKVADTLRIFDYDQEVVRRYLKGLEFGTAKTNPIDEEIEAVLIALNGWVNSPRWRLNATGMSNYTTSVKGVNGAGSSAGFGVAVDWKSGRRINVMGTVTQSRDTITSIDVADFSQTVLVPGIRRFSILAIYRELYAISRSKNGSGKGWGVFVNATPVNWKTFSDTSSTGTERDTISVVRAVTPFTFEVFASSTLLFDRSSANSARITFDYGISLKYLGTNGMSSKDQRLFMGTTQDFFAGPMCGIDIRIADSHMYFYGTYLFQGDKGSIPGLTGPQLHAGISLTATIADLGK